MKQKMSETIVSRVTCAFALLLGASQTLPLVGVAAQGRQQPRTIEVAANQPEQADAESNRQARLAQMFDIVARQLGKRQSTVRVVIRLRDKGLGNEASAEVALSQARRAQVRNVQDKFLAKLALPEAQRVKRFNSLPLVVVELDENVLAQLRQLDEIDSVKIDQHDEPSLAQSTNQINAPAAWNQGFTGAGQTIAILDTGVDNDHSFLAGKIVSEACFSSNSGNSQSVCPGGVETALFAGSADNVSSAINGFDHGTHVAGIAAGFNSNVSGVAPAANLIAIQVFSRFNDQDDCGTTPAPCMRSFRSDQMLGLERVLDLSDNFNIAAVNMSLGSGSFGTFCDSQDLEYASLIGELRNARIATVVSSGNGGNKNGIAFPACISTAISVGSVGDGGTVNGVFAPTDVVVSTSQSAAILQLLAPGRWINSSVPGNAFGNKSGTSMAAPHVAGAFAVLKDKVGNASVNDMLTILKNTGLSVTDTNGIAKRRINLGAAINALCAPSSYTLSSTSSNFDWLGGTRTITVSSNASCVWQARSNASWITVNSPVDTGNGTFTITVGPNPFFFSSRTGTVTIGGRTHTVRQDDVF